MSARAVDADGEVVDGVRLRSMTVEDLDEVVVLEMEVGGRGWSRRSFAAELDEPATRRYLVAEQVAGGTGGEPGRIVGFAGAHVVVGEVRIANVAVHPRVRRRGVATRLLEALLDDARRAGATAATLEVRVGNAPARALYRRLGFVDEGSRPRYYPDGEDAVIMWRRDEDEGRG